jgi:hypothetical protein
MISKFCVIHLVEKMKLKQWFPWLWVRNVDDGLAVVDRERIDEILSNINSFNLSIKFTLQTTLFFSRKT